MAKRPKLGCKHRTYIILKGMKQRCTDPNHNAYERYGARGVEIHQPWLDDYREFQRWALSNGYEDHLTIDRIDNDGHYTPENCQWVSMKVQAHNKTNNVMTMADAEALRSDHATGKFTMRALASLYGLNVSGVHRIVHRQSWTE